MEVPSLSASQVPSCGELKSGGGFPGRRRERPPRPPHWRPTDPSGTPTPPVQLGVLTAPGFCFSHSTTSSMGVFVSHGRSESCTVRGSLSCAASPNQAMDARSYANAASASLSKHPR